MVSEETEAGAPAVEPVVEEIGIRTAPAPKPAKAAKTAKQEPQPAAQAAPAPEADITTLVGVAFDAFAAEIGDAPQMVYREVDADSLRTVEAVTALARELGEDINARKAPGRRAEVVTFDLVQIGERAFMGARVRFV